MASIGQFFGNLRTKLANFSLTERQKSVALVVTTVLLLGGGAYLVTDKILTGKKLDKVTTQKDSLNTENTKLKDDIQNKYIKDIEQKDELITSKDSLLTKQEKKLKELQRLVRRQDSILKSLTQTIKNALLSYKADELSVEIKNGKIYISMQEKLLFKSGKADIEPKGVNALQKLAKILSKNRDIIVDVEGHTDTDPIYTKQFRDNWDLSVARATAIIRVLGNYRVEPTRMIASGRGEFFPVAPNNTYEGKAKNRRTEIILSPRLDELYRLIK